MKKLVGLIFGIVVVHFAFAQPSDSLKYVTYRDELGVERKAPMIYANQILVVKGDSIFFFPDESELRNFINKNQRFDIIDNRDSVAAILRKHIKALIVIKNKKD